MKIFHFSGNSGRSTKIRRAALVWEISIKRSLGKLYAPEDLEAAMVDNRFLPLPVSVPHALAVAQLPDHYRDPFDRLVIAQARLEGFHLVSRDPFIKMYDVPLLKA